MSHSISPFILHEYPEIGTISDPRVLEHILGLERLEARSCYHLYLKISRIPELVTFLIKLHPKVNYESLRVISWEFGFLDEELAPLLHFLAEHPLGSVLSQEDLSRNEQLVAQKIQLILNFSGHLQWESSEVAYYQELIFGPGSLLHFEDLKWLNDRQNTLSERYQWPKQVLWDFVTTVKGWRDTLELLVEREYQYKEGDFSKALEVSSTLAIYFFGLDHHFSRHAQFFVGEFLKVERGDERKAYRTARKFFRRNNPWCEVFVQDLSRGKAGGACLLAEEGSDKFRFIVKFPLSEVIRETALEILQELLALSYESFSDILKNLPVIQELRISLEDAVHLQKKTCFRLLDELKNTDQEFKPFFPLLVQASLREEIDLIFVYEGLKLCKANFEVPVSSIMHLLGEHQDFCSKLSRWGELSKLHSRSMLAAHNIQGELGKIGCEVGEILFDYYALPDQTGGPAARIT